MHKINQVSGWALVSMLAIFSFSACKKEKKIYTPVPFLTGKSWNSDTITINPPVTYNQLSTADQQFYQSALLWFGNATISFNDDGTVTSGGDYDWGYQTWKLVNNKADIQVHSRDGNDYLLRNWTADAVQLSYTIQLNNSVDCSLVYR
jgi:hypothetical protein